MLSSHFCCSLLLTTAVFLLFAQIAHANPLTQATIFKDDIAKESVEESSDLNVSSRTLITDKDAQEVEDSPEASSFAHHDEDLPRTPTSLESEVSLKYDVEILESRDIKKENIGVEERFKGAAIRMNTDTFADENIEVNGGDDDLAGRSMSKLQSHKSLTIILLVVAFVSIGLYAALVMWRAHLEQRYGMRELLVTNEHDDDLRPTNNDSNNDSCYRSTTTTVDTR